MKKWEQFTDEQLIQMIKDSKSYRTLAEKLGYNPDAGSTYLTIKEMIAIKNFDISHFTFQGWNKNNFDYSRFYYGNNIKVADALNALCALRGRKCENCGLDIWQGGLIPLEIHHIDGDHLNNDLTNLQILCCNCHALTKNYKGKNIGRKKEEYISDEIFVEALKNTPNVRQALLKLGLNASGGNYSRAYELKCKYNI